MRAYRSSTAVTNAWRGTEPDGREAEACNETERATRVRPLAELSVEEARARELDALRARDVVSESVAEVRDLELPGPRGSVPVRAYLPAGAPVPAPALVWFPGGGWVVGSLEAADPLCRKLANAVPCVIVSVSYRQAPEHRFPAAVEDCLAATRWVVDDPSALGLDPDRVAVGGASAGGNLAAVVAQLARSAIDLPLVFQLLVYPPTDHRAVEDCEARAETSFDRAAARWCWRHYLGDGDGDDPRASPLRAPDLRGLPPALVITAERDALRDEAGRYADRLEDAAVPTERAHYDASHGFFSTPGAHPGDDAQARAIAALRRAFAHRVPGRAE